MKTELQAVILAAGKGSRMSELTNKKPKCLLPLANKPLIHYPLKMLIDANFKDVIIIIPDLFENEIKSELINEYKINMDFFVIPFDEEFGTVDSLRMIKNKLYSDVLLLSCDIISDYPLKNLINFHRVENPSLSVLLANESTVISQGVVPGRKGKFKTDKDIIGIDPENFNRIVFFNSEADFDEIIDFKVSTIKQCSNIDLHTKYLDGHVYIFKNYLLNYLMEKPKISSFKGEFIPHLIQYQFKKNQKFNDSNFDESNQGSFLNESNNTFKKDIFSFIKIDQLEKEMNRFSPLNIKKHESEVKFDKDPSEFVKCLPIIVNNNNYFIARANNILTYYEINKLSKKLVPDYQSISFGRAQITDDCIIDNSCKINERTSIKKTIIGKNCIINEKVQLENCLIMDNVQINTLCVLKNCIICSNVKIGEKTKLTDCIIASDQIVHDSTELHNETVVQTDQLMEI